jgi:hypothetical protein
MTGAAAECVKVATAIVMQKTTSSPVIRQNGPGEIKATK